MYKLLEQLRSESDKARVELADEVRLAEKSKTPETHAEKLSECEQSLARSSADPVDSRAASRVQAELAESFCVRAAAVLELAPLD